jgi:hypothetical protein
LITPTSAFSCSICSLVMAGSALLVSRDMHEAVCCWVIVWATNHMYSVPFTPHLNSGGGGGGDGGDESLPVGAEGG